MKLFTTVAFLLMGTVSLTAQEQHPPFQKGKSYVSAGYGLQVASPKLLFGLYTGPFGLKIKGYGPICAKYELAAGPKFGIGFTVGYRTTTVSWNVPDTVKNTAAIFGVKGNYSKLTITPRFNFHFGKGKKFDPYIGFGVGYRKRKASVISEDTRIGTITVPQVIPLSFEATFGLRGWFTDQIGAFAEIGAGHGFLQVGAVGKF